jgi:hypothetical protein
VVSGSQQQLMGSTDEGSSGSSSTDEGASSSRDVAVIAGPDCPKVGSPTKQSSAAASTSMFGAPKSDGDKLVFGSPAKVRMETGVQNLQGHNVFEEVLLDIIMRPLGGWYKHWRTQCIRPLHWASKLAEQIVVQEEKKWSHHSARVKYPQL